MLSSGLKDANRLFSYSASILISLHLSFAFCQDYKPAKWIPSPNMTEGKSREIKYIVIHTVEGSLKGCVSWFKNPDSKVSAHYVVGFTGEVVQMVKEADIAWHAGDWKMNTESIGIEHEGYAAKDLWTSEQYEASATLVAYLCKKYNIPVDRKHLLAHSEVTPGRKTDPGPHFDWDRFLAMIKNGGKWTPARKPTQEKQQEKPAENAQRDDPARWKKLLDIARSDEKSGDYYYSRLLYRKISTMSSDEEIRKLAADDLKRIEADAEIMKKIEQQERDYEANEWMRMAKSYYANGSLENALEFSGRIVSIYPDSVHIKEAKKIYYDVKALLKDSDK